MKISKFFGAVALTVLTAACSWSEYEDPVLASAEIVNVPTDQVQFKSYGDTKALDLRANGPLEVKVEEGADWIDAVLGEDRILRIKVTENKTPLVRSGKIAVICGKDTSEISVTQEAMKIQFKISSDNLDGENQIKLGSAAFSEVLTVNANWGWTVSSDASWLKVSAPAAGSDGLIPAGDAIVVTLSADAAGEDDNIANVTFSSADAVDVIKVVQEGTRVYIELDQASLKFPCTASDIVLKAVAYADWSVQSKPDWITLTPDSGAAGSVDITVSAEANTALSRSGKIVFKAGTKIVDLPVVQSPQSRTIILSFYDTATKKAVSPFTKDIPTNQKNSCNLGVQTMTVKDQTDIQVDMFNNLSFMHLNGANGLYVGLSSVSGVEFTNKTRDEQYWYFKFPALEDLALVKVDMICNNGSLSAEMFITTDPGESNADAKSKALTTTATTNFKITNPYSFIPNEPQTNTEYYLMGTKNGVNLKLWSLTLYYE